MQNINKDIYPHISSKQAIGDLNHIIYYDQRNENESINESIEEYMTKLRSFSDLCAHRWKQLSALLNIIVHMYMTKLHACPLLPENSSTCVRCSYPRQDYHFLIPLPSIYNAIDSLSHFLFCSSQEGGICIGQHSELGNPEGLMQSMNWELAPTWQ